VQLGLLVIYLRPADKRCPGEQFRHPEQQPSLEILLAARRHLLGFALS
jgi:hypothetical protein